MESFLSLASIIIIPEAGQHFFFKSIECQIELAANNWFDVMLVRLLHKLKYTEHISVIGDGNGFHSVSHSFLHHRADVSCTVKQRVLCVAMEMNKFWHL